MYSALRPALFALEPERAHRVALHAARLAAWLPAHGLAAEAPLDLMGLRFPNRVGLAAGFDKNGEAVDGLGRLGFGFIEVGTVTPKPQSGQRRPRLFRLPRSHALINRLGFPSQGAAVVAERLRHRRYAGVVGVNIGKNALTPIDAAVEDYVFCLRALGATADYVAINISSPNTPGLRDLQLIERLEPLLKRVLSERNTLSQSLGRPLPVVLKVSPDLDADALAGIARIATEVSLDGIIGTNTTIRRDASLLDEEASESGGLSGEPLYRLSLQTMATLRQLVGPAFPLIGVGGIDSSEKAASMIAAGADLVQLYTGLVYRGPSLVGACVRSTGC